MKCNTKKIIKFCGSILMLIACVFIGQRLYNYRNQIVWEQIFARKEIVVIEIVSYALVMLMSPRTYQILIWITTGKKIPFAEIQNVCCISNIYKYVPGNIFQYVGRNQLAIEQDLKHSEVAMATILEIGIIICSSVVVTLLMARDAAFVWLERYGISEWIIKGMIIVVCLTGMVIFFLRKKVSAIGKKILEFCSRGKIFRLLEAGGWFSFILILNGMLFGFSFRIVGIQLSFYEMYTVVGLYALSFCVGYVMPGVPGGIGVREAILMFFMGDIIENTALVTVTVLFRVISILGDVLAYFAVELLKAGRRQRRSPR